MREGLKFRRLLAAFWEGLKLKMLLATFLEGLKFKRILANVLLVMVFSGVIVPGFMTAVGTFTPGMEMAAEPPKVVGCV